MVRDFDGDLKRLKNFAFRRAERSGPTLQKFAQYEARILAMNNSSLIWRAYDWLCVPLSLWPVDFEGLSRHLLGCIESKVTLDSDLLMLLELIGPPPDKKTITAVGEFEHVVESGNYDHLVKCPEKFAEIEASLKNDAELGKAWNSIKSRWDVQTYRNPRGVIRRRLSQERNLRGDWSFDWQDEKKKFDVVFDAMCYRWKLYGMEFDKPLALKISVNPTPHGTMIVIPREWSLDRGRDLHWDKIAKLHRSHGAHRQGPKWSRGRLEKQKDAVKVLGFWNEAGKLGKRGAKRYDFVHEKMKRDGRTDQSWVLRHLRIARKMPKSQRGG